MVSRSDIQRDKNASHGWFGTNGGTHWTVAGSVAVIVFGSYLIYNNRDHNPTGLTAVPIAAEQAQAPIAPAALN